MNGINFKNNKEDNQHVATTDWMFNGVHVRVRTLTSTYEVMIFK
jgi:hypothetical protein